MQKGLLNKAETVKSLAQRNGVTVNYINDLVAKGMKFEAEHSRDPHIQRTIAIQHLSEDLRYYSALKKMENQLKKTAPAMEKGGDIGQFIDIKEEYALDSIFMQLARELENPADDYSKEGFLESLKLIGDGEIEQKDTYGERLKYTEFINNNSLILFVYSSLSYKDKGYSYEIIVVKNTNPTTTTYGAGYGNSGTSFANYPELLRYSNGYTYKNKEIISKACAIIKTYFKIKFTTKQDSFQKGGSLEEKVSNTPAGGALVSVIDGKQVVHNDGSKGGMFQGRRHTENGIKGIVDGSSPVEVEDEEALIIPEAVNKPGTNNFNGKQLSNKEILSQINTQAGGVPIKKAGGEIKKDGGAVNDDTAGQAIRLKGSSVIITRNALLDDTKKDFNGEMLTNKQILSKINQSGGGAAFADGGNLPEQISCSTNQYYYGGKMMHAEEIATDMNNSCGCKHSMETGGNVSNKTAYYLADTQYYGDWDEMWVAYILLIKEGRGLSMYYDEEKNNFYVWVYKFSMDDAIRIGKQFNLDINEQNIYEYLVDTLLAANFDSQQGEGIEFGRYDTYEQAFEFMKDYAKNLGYTNLVKWDDSHMKVSPAQATAIAK